MKKDRKIWLISDTHFNHKTILEMRGDAFNFKSIDSMNDFIISNWNKLVGDNDIVYHLGDFCLGKKEECYKSIIPQLKGKIYFIKGNHDPLYFSSIMNMFIRFKGQLIELVHNPEDAIGCSDIIIHGHNHIEHEYDLTLLENKHFFNVNLEFNKFRPFLINEVLGGIKRKRKSSKVKEMVICESGHYDLGDGVPVFLEEGEVVRSWVLS